MYVLYAYKLHRRKGQVRDNDKESFGGKEDVKFTLDRNPGDKTFFTFSIVNYSTVNPDFQTVDLRDSTH